MKNKDSANTATGAAAVAPSPPPRGPKNATAARGMANGASDRVGAAAARTGSKRSCARASSALGARARARGSCRILTVHIDRPREEAHLVGVVVVEES